MTDILCDEQGRDGVPGNGVENESMVSENKR